MIVLVRHGRTDHNAAGLLLGRIDPPLDELGQRQAASLGRAVRGCRRVVVSPLLRARQTAEAIGLPVTVDERWIELDYGEYDGTPLGDIPPVTWSRWRSDPHFCPPGGETIAEMSARVRAACYDLEAEAVDHDIAVVTHVSPIKAAVAWALGVPDETCWRMFVGQASVSRIAVNPNGPVLSSFNEVAHLPPA